MKVFFFCAFFFLSLKAHALYVNDIAPKGMEVPPDIHQIQIDFSNDIIPLGTTKFKEEHSSKIVVTQGLDCGLSYQGTKTIVCRIKKPLLPNKEYKITIRSGFTGSTTEERIPYEYTHTFKTSPLSIMSYNVDWNDMTPVIALELNYKVKEKDRSGIIQCPSREIGVTFEPMKDKNGEASFRVKANGPLNENESCSFYFNRPLDYRDSVGGHVPEQKVVLSPAIKGVSENEGSYYTRATCAGNNQLYVNLFNSGMPHLLCEFNEAVLVDLFLNVNSSLDIKKFVTIIPNDGVQVSYTDMGLKLSNFPSANKTYIVKIHKGLPTSEKGLSQKEIFFQVETINNPPLLSAAKAVGVIEKDGPWQVAYSALNVKAVELTYGFLDKSSDLGGLNETFPDAAKLTEKKTYPITSKENENVLYPLEVKDLAKDKKFSAGLFSGVLRVKEADKKYLDAENVIFEDDETKKQRKEFQFAYLFTDIGLHVKKGRAGLLVWAFSMKHGTPLSGTEIKLYVNGAGEETMTTDDEGLAFFKDFSSKRGERFSVVATKGDDISYLNNNSNWNAGISRWDFNFGGNYWQEPNDLLVDIVSERPLYLPGEEVNLKLFVRKFIPDSLKLMDAGKKLKVSISNSREEEVLVKTLELNDFGTATIHYKLPLKAATGRYHVYVREGNSSLGLESVFQVEEFRKPDFKVTVQESKDSFDGKITYFKGGPVANASGEVAVLFRKASLKLKDDTLDRFSFPNSIWSYYDYYEGPSGGELRVLSRNEIESDEKGEFKVNKAEITNSLTEYGNIIVEGIFEDENGGKISGRTETLHNPFDLIPGLKLTKWMYDVGEKVSPEVVVLDKAGNAVKGVGMKITMKLVTYFYERRLGSGNYFYYDSRREETEVESCSFDSAVNFEACDLTPKKPGYYEFTVKVTDSKYKADEARTSTYVYEKGSFLGFEASNHDRINLSVDKTKVKLGDKLKVMAISPLQNATALITFERDGILHKELVKFEGNVLLYEKEITDEKLIPGFYVSVVIIKGRTSDKIEGNVDLGKPAFKIGYKKIEVENTEKRLSLKVLPMKKQVRPGEMMEAEIKVSDFKNKGIRSELAIAVVDDALLSVSGPYKGNYDILDTFYSLNSLGVDNFQTLTHLIGRRTFGKKGANAGGGGGFTVRSDFKNTAYWNAQVVTDENGVLKFKFKVPDNLTTWKIIAVAVDKEHRFGYGEEEFLASKPLMVEPALPNFLVEGDKFQAKVTITNRSGGNQNLKVSAISSALKLEKSEEKLGLLHDEKKSTSFLASALVPGKADITVKAEGQGVNDGFKTTLPVLSSAIHHAFGTSGVVGEKEVTLPLTIADTVKPNSQSLTVQYSNSAINGLDQVFKYVLGYPYGCWEQRLTKAYFLVQYEEFKSMLTYRFPETEGAIKTEVQKLLDLAGDYQTMSGGMRYYPGGHDEADVYLSVFTGYAFATMKKLGYKIDPKFDANLRAYLKGLLTSDINWNSWYAREAKNSTKALLLNVLTELGEKNLSGSVAKLFSERESLDLFGLGYLTGYMSQEKAYQNEAKTLMDKLDSLKVTESGRVAFKEPYAQNNSLSKFWNYTDTRATCAVLQNLTKYSKNKAELSGVVKQVLFDLGRDGHWYNTQENIYCFEALRLFVEKFESKDTKAKLALKVDSREIKKEPKVQKGNSTLILDANDIKKDVKSVSLKANGGELYYSSILRYETPFVVREKVEQGFSLSKKFFKLETNGAKASWFEVKDETLRLKRGDVLRVVIDVSTPSDRYQVMLNDNLAGCLEPINTQLATTSLTNEALLQSPKTYQWETPYYRGDGFEYLDLRLDAAQFYARKLGKGTFKVEYMVQTIATGEFTLPEATVEEMYYPDVRGTEKGRKLIVTE